MTAGGRFRGSRAHPVMPPRRAPSAVVLSCLTESFPADNDDLTSQDLLWTLDKNAQAFPTDGTTNIFSYGSFSHGPYAGGLHVVDQRLALAKPGVSASSADGAYDAPIWGYTTGNAILETVLPSGDISVTYTLVAVPVTDYDLASATPICRSWGASPYLRFDEDTFDGWNLFLGNFGNTADDFSAFVNVTWDGGIKSFDPNAPYDTPPGILPFEVGDEITFAVTGTGADTRIVATRNGVTFVDLFGSTLSTANGGDFSGFPAGTKADLWLYMQGARLSDDAGPGNSPHYPFFGPISDAMNDTLAIDDVSFCPAVPPP